MKKWLRSLGIFVIVALMASVVSAAGPADPAKEFLVGFGKGGPAAAKAAGVKLENEWTEINAGSVRMSETALKQLVKNGVFEYYEEPGTFTKMALYNDGTYTWGLQAVKAPEAWALGATGTNIKVCILDTGIDYGHPAFVRNGVSIIKGSKNFVADGHPDATDGDGHGTHVAGTVAGQGMLNGSYFGTAPGVDLYIGRVLGDDGTGSSTGIINGVNWCTDTVKAHIISMSLGGGRKSTTEQKTYTSVWNKGVLTIAAAGNAGNSTISYPAGYTNVISVAAVDSNLNKADFSQYNSDVELAGPGVGVLSSVPRGTGLAATAYEGTTAYKSGALEFSPTGDVSGQLVECGLADSTSSCVNKPTTGTWIAVVSRGTIAFSDKVNNVMAQGAKAAIITNNDTALPDDPGTFTLGAAGNWIPTVSVSYNSGVAIRNGGLGTGRVLIQPVDYDYFNGTSMATPHVSAVAALAWSAKPTLTNATIAQVLRDTVMDLGAAGRDVNFGYGLVQADKAVNLAKTK